MWIKLRHREVKELAWGHTVNGRAGFELRESLTPEPNHSRKLGIAGEDSGVGEQFSPGGAAPIHALCLKSNW